MKMCGVALRGASIAADTIQIYRTRLWSLRLEVIKLFVNSLVKRLSFGKKTVIRSYQIIFSIKIIEFKYFAHNVVENIIFP